MLALALLLLPAAGLLLLRPPSEIPEWEHAYYNKTPGEASWGTYGGGACLPFTGGCGHLSAMCGLHDQFAAQACTSFAGEVSEAFETCKKSAFAALANETTHFQTCLSSHYPRSECSEDVCKDSKLGEPRSRCVDSCRQIGTCFSSCAVQFPWPATVGDCVSACMGPVPDFGWEDGVEVGQLVQVVAKGATTTSTTTVPYAEVHSLTFVGDLSTMNTSQVEAVKGEVQAAIATAANVRLDDVLILTIMPGTAAPVMLQVVKANTILVQFELVSGHLEETVLSSQLHTAGLTMTSFTASPPTPAPGPLSLTTPSPDLVSVYDDAGLDPPDESHKSHADKTGVVTKVDAAEGITVKFDDGQEVTYPSAAILIPDATAASPCTSVKCGYLRMTNATMGNVHQQLKAGRASAESMANATRVVTVIANLFTPAPTGPPPTPFPWEFLRKRIQSQGGDNPFAAFEPPTPLPSAAALATTVER